MVSHSAYGREILQRAAGDACSDDRKRIAVTYGSGGNAYIDGVVGSTIAVEVESRTAKQVRGAVLDLICHNYPKKLLLLIPMHMYDVEVTATQCQYILGRFAGMGNAEVVRLRGTGHVPHADTDVPLVRDTLTRLGWSEERGAPPV